MLLQVCSKCDKHFLRPGNIERHQGSKTCKRQQNEKGENVVLATSIKRAKQLQDICVEKEKSKLDNKIGIQAEWANQIKGSALKSQQPKKPNVRFNENQISIMVDCYNQGKDKGKRFTPKQCQAVMKNHPSISSSEVLNENQIRSFWSRYHRNKNNK